jgi:hypothetical protein
MMRSLKWPNAGAIVPLTRPLLTGLAISGMVTLCVSLALSGLSKSASLTPLDTPPSMPVIQFATVEPVKQVERKALPVTPALPAVTARDANNTPEISAPRAARTATRDRAATAVGRSAQRKLAVISTMHQSMPDYQRVEIGNGTVAAAPIDIRPAAQRIASNRSIEAEFWRLAAPAGTAISELVPRRRSMSRAVDAVRQRIASLIDVLR